MKKSITGFSKLSKSGKMKWMVENFFKDPERVMKELMSYWLLDEEKQKLLDGFSENTISNFYLPYGVAPNFLINGKTYCIPMVIEESSVVAAAASAAKFWQKRGGFTAKVLSTSKVGQIHFNWGGQIELLKAHMDALTHALTVATDNITESMRKRGGGIRSIELVDQSASIPDCYQLQVKFETVDSMGANFINTVLEVFSKTLVSFIEKTPGLKEVKGGVDIIMSILSNYTPDCLVRSEVSCPVSDLGNEINGMSPSAFASKFWQAVRIAQIDPYRATTHNKGIFNGIDAVVLATANDFRAIEACGHTYAARNGAYQSLTQCSLDDGMFRFWIEIPLALGTIGGLTSLHPMAKRSLELLENPDAETLMQIIASVGLAQNFAALRSLVTTGIQKGHMRMHLVNILNRLDASEKEMKEAILYFKDKVISFSAVQDFLKLFRSRDQNSTSQEIITEMLKNN
jgi:hydroxymethylglutaryl-CoA reductase